MINESLVAELRKFLTPEQLLLEEPMSSHTTFRIGGPADYLIFPSSLPQLRQIFQLLRAYEVPFLFMDAGGTLNDITTFSHEFGHYLDGYLNYNADETVDLAECFSQAMELLMLTRLDDVLTEKELDSLYQIKMGDILGMYVQQGAFAEFEHVIYGAKPEELSVDFLNSAFLQAAQDYGFAEEGFEDLYSMFWMDITHFFEQPFYVITYPVSHDIAMQIFQLEQAQPGQGMEKYLEMLDRDYADMLDTALNAGLESPFDEACLRTVCAAADKWLDEYDMTGIE